MIDRVCRGSAVPWKLEPEVLMPCHTPPQTRSIRRDVKCSGMCGWREEEDVIPLANESGSPRKVRAEAIVEANYWLR